MEPVLGKPSSKDSYLTDLDFIVVNSNITKLDVLCFNRDLQGVKTLMRRNRAYISITIMNSKLCISLKYLKIKRRNFDKNIEQRN